MDNLKALVGYKAVDDYVRSNMTIGLGTGSTVHYVIERIGYLVKNGKIKNIVCIPTSVDTEVKAKNIGLPLVELTSNTKIDLTIDGVDEVDSNLNLIKGRGGALVREKMVAASSSFFIIVADESKLYPNGIGASGAMPIEILMYGYKKIIECLLKIPELSNCTYKLRECNGELFITDNKNYIADFFFPKPIENLLETSKQIKLVTGVIDHGIFANMADVVIISKSDGSFLTLTKK